LLLKRENPGLIRSKLFGTSAPGLKSLNKKFRPTLNYHLMEALVTGKEFYNIDPRRSLSIIEVAT